MKHIPVNTVLERLAKYADMFGLNETSGLEIPEMDPKISDEDSVRSAMGQGTNNFTTSQLARYITAIANQGTLFNLSLLDHVENVDGEVTEEFESGQPRQIEGISQTTWDAVHAGMRGVGGKQFRIHCDERKFCKRGRERPEQRSKVQHMRIMDFL